MSIVQKKHSLPEFMKPKTNKISKNKHQFLQSSEKQLLIISNFQIENK